MVNLRGGPQKARGEYDQLIPHGPTTVALNTRAMSGHAAMTAARSESTGSVTASVPPGRSFEEFPSRGPAHPSEIVLSGPSLKASKIRVTCHACSSVPLVGGRCSRMARANSFTSP